MIFFRKFYMHVNNFFIINLLMYASLYAHGFDEQLVLADVTNWHPLFGVHTGLAFMTNAGRSQIFPIINQDTDQYYIYNADDQNKIPAMYGAFVGLEWRGDSNWSFQINADYNQTSSFFVGGTLLQGIDKASESAYSYEYQIKARQLLAQVKVQYSGCSKINPYLLFGIGASLNSAFDFTTTVPVTIASTRSYEKSLSTSCSYALGLGLDLFIIEQVRFGIGYRFADLRKLSLGAASINNVSVVGTLSQNNLYANQFLAQLSVVF